MKQKSALLPVLAVVVRVLGRLPLGWLHGLGALAGRIALRCDAGYAARLRENLSASGLAQSEPALQALLRTAAEEAGKAVLELCAVWFRPSATVQRLVVEVHGTTLVEAARQAGRGILFLTPHMGCFEIAARWAAARVPITVLYRRPRLAWLEPLMAAGRGDMTLAPADLGGVRKLLRALRKGEAVGILPDQVPARGEGAWAPFFGRPAWTMTLALRLARSTGCTPLLAFAERLPRGAGYVMHFEPLPDSARDEAGLNAAVERLIARCPAQYLWGYNRYKVPAGVPAPASDAVPGAP